MFEEDASALVEGVKGKVKVTQVVAYRIGNFEEGREPVVYDDVTYLVVRMSFPIELLGGVDLDNVQLWAYTYVYDYDEQDVVDGPNVIELERMDTQYNPTIETPITAAPGDTIEIRGEGFKPSSKVEIRLDGDKILEATTDQEGRLKASYDIPIWMLMPPDDYLITVNDDTGTAVAYGLLSVRTPLTEQRKTLEETLTSSNQEINQLKTDMDTLQERISSVENEKNQLQQQVDKLKTEKETLQNDMRKLDTELRQATAERNNLETQVADLENRLMQATAGPAALAIIFLALAVILILKPSYAEIMKKRITRQHK